MQEKTPSTGDGADGLLLEGIEDAHGIAIRLAAFHKQFLKFILFHNQNLLSDNGYMGLYLSYRYSRSMVMP